MEKMTILRIFAWFPLIGMLGPDLVAKITSRAYVIPTFHIIAEILLTISIVVLSLIIAAHNKRETGSYLPQGE